MADIKLFNIKGSVQELQSGTVNLEKELQTVIERNMKTFFEIAFLAKENVINQGLFYLDWLLCIWTALRRLPLLQREVFLLLL